MCDKNFSIKNLLISHIHGNKCPKNNETENTSIHKNNISTDQNDTGYYSYHNSIISKNESSTTIDIKNYICDYCHKNFAKKNLLKLHILGFCDENFSSPENTTCRKRKNSNSSISSLIDLTETVPIKKYKNNNAEETTTTKNIENITIKSSVNFCIYCHCKTLARR